MADTKLVGAKGLGCTSKRSLISTDPVPPTLAGNGTSENPLQVINVAAQPLVPLGTRVTIHARLSGDDKKGDGSLANPYRTLQRCMLDVPLIIPPNLWYLVDISGLGLETLPTDYALPPITQGSGPDFDFSGIGPAAYSSQFVPLTIYAEPQLIASMPAAEAVIGPDDIESDDPDPNTGLRTLTLVSPRDSWGVDRKGNFAVGSLEGNDNATILETTATTITYASSTALTAPIRLMESSTTLTGNVSPEGFFRGALTVIGSTQVLLLGVSIVPPPGSELLGFLAEKCWLVALRLGKFVDINLECPLMRPRSCYITVDPDGLNSQFFARGDFSAQNSLIEGTVFAAELLQYNFITCKLDGVERIGEVTDYSPGIFPYAVPTFNMESCLVVNSPSDAIVFQGANGTLSRVTINDSQGNAVVATSGFLNLTRVEGVGNGAGGSGLGLFADTGARVSVDADTTVTGVDGDLRSGSLPVPAGGWADLPQIDYTYNPTLGASAQVIGTGTNVFPI